jgi:hypothetical protein
MDFHLIKGRVHKSTDGQRLLTVYGVLLDQHLRKALFIPIVNRQINLTFMRLYDFNFLAHLPAPVSLVDLRHGTTD